MSVYLTPNKTSPTYRLMNPPVAPLIRIRRSVLNDMANLVDLAKGEVGWFCTVIDHGTHDDQQIFELDGVYLFEQQVHGATTEISAEGISKVTFAMLEEDNYNPDIRVNRMYCWGHSHVNMETIPSGQDEAQMRIFAGNDMPVALRLIANKKGTVRIDAFFYETGIALLECPWEVIEETSRMDHWKQQMDAMVSEIVITPKKPLNGQGVANRKGGVRKKDRKKFRRGRLEDLQQDVLGDLTNFMPKTDPGYGQALADLIMAELTDADSDKDLADDLPTLVFSHIISTATDSRIVEAVLKFSHEEWSTFFEQLGVSPDDAGEDADTLIEELRNADLA